MTNRISNKLDLILAKDKHVSFKTGYITCNYLDWFTPSFNYQFLIKVYFNYVRVTYKINFAGGRVNKNRGHVPKSDPKETL